jgi:hypothetical protein
MREAGAPSTEEVVVVLSVEGCTPHRGWSWPHHRRSSAIPQGCEAKAARMRIEESKNARPRTV